MKIKQLLKKLQESPEFKEWKKENKDAYLTYLFVMLEADKKQFKIGYSQGEENMVTSFDLTGKIEIEPPAKAFREEKTKIPELNLDKVKLDYEEVLDLATKHQKEKYAKEIPLKMILILQHLDLGQVWNVTFLMQSFKTLNMKIDASTGKIKFEDFFSIINPF